MKFKPIIITVLVLALAAVSVGAVTVINRTPNILVKPAPVTVVAAAVTYDDVLSFIHPGQWFGWADPTDKIYANLIVLDSQYSKPTKPELLAAQAELQLQRDTAASLQATLSLDRAAIESRISDGTYTNTDLVNYLRILGGF